MEQNRRETFFTKEKGFYTTLFRMMLVSVSYTHLTLPTNSLV